MKIGILTQPLEENYGGVLQAYALQKVLKDMGHEVVTINRINEDDRQNFIARLRIFLFRLRKFPEHKNFRYIYSHYFFSRKKRNIVNRHTYRFVARYIRVSPRLRGEKQFCTYIRRHPMECYIVGSDQCWRPVYSPHLPAYFLNFIPQGQIVKRIAYAVSFGVDFWEYTPAETAMAKKLIALFDAVSVREESGISLCREYLERNDVQQMPDPTLLLERNMYVELIKQADTYPSEGELMTYLLDRTLEKEAIVRKIAEIFHYTPFAVQAENTYFVSNYIPRQTPSMEECIQPPVEQWLRGFTEARFVVTDSFHGCIFSLIFNKPFLAIGNPGRGNARFYSLLNAFGLESRLIFSFNEATEELVGRNIDWETINKEISRRQLSARAFLQESLQ